MPRYLYFSNGVCRLENSKNAKVQFEIRNFSMVEKEKITKVYSFYIVPSMQCQDLRFARLNFSIRRPNDQTNV